MSKGIEDNGGSAYYARPVYLATTSSFTLVALPTTSERHMLVCRQSAGTSFVTIPITTMMTTISTTIKV